jgi:hypothetical protein
MWSVLTSMSGARVENCVITAATGHLPVTESVVLPPDPRDHIMSAFCRPPCPKRKNMTMLARITPGLTGFHI